MAAKTKKKAPPKTKRVNLTFCMADYKAVLRWAKAKRLPISTFVKITVLDHVGAKNEDPIKIGRGKLAKQTKLL